MNNKKHIKNFNETSENINTSNHRILAEKIILALDSYGRKINRVEYGLPIDPDTKDFEDTRPQEMLKIVTKILKKHE